ncbi:MAG: NfeD family protein [Ardenticatenaceae bacterium]
MLALLFLFSRQATSAALTAPLAPEGAAQTLSGVLMQSGGWVSIVAIIIAVLAVLITLSAVLVWEMRRLIDDKALIKQVLDGDTILTEVFPFVTRKTQTELLSEPEQSALQTAIGHLLPAGWASQQTEGALEALYQFVDDKEQAAPDLALDLGPLFSALKGKEGRKAIRSLVEGIPNCPGMRAMPQPGLFGLPSCLPVGMSRRQVANQIQKGLNKELSKRLRPIGKTSVFGVAELEKLIPNTSQEEEPPSLQSRFQDFRKSIVQTRRMSWILWLVALIALALTLYFAGAVGTGIALWLGWPLAITGLAVLGVSFLILMRIRNQFAGPGQPKALGEWLEVPLGLWERRVRIWSGGFVLVGVVLLLIGYFVPA